MEDKKQYVAPPQEGNFKRILRLIKMIFKTPYKYLTWGQRCLKALMQLLIVAAILFIAYIVLSIIVGIILAIIVLFALSSLGRNGEVEVIDEWGNRKKYKEY